MTLLVAPWVEKVFTFSLELSEPQMLGLAFLLGSFVVASLSDLKRLSAQREFLEIWVLFTVGVLIYDVTTSGLDAWNLWQVVAVKWGLITVLAVLSWQKVGGIFKLARADVFACTSAAALLSPLLVVAFWIVLKIVAFALRPVLSKGRGPWPFMPVVTVATLVVLALGLVVPEFGLSILP